MDQHNFFVNVLIYLGFAVLCVPVFKRLGLGSVLGYLAAGILIGPFGLQLVADPSAILHFSEFGVVLLLFIIGLELLPSRLWVLRKSVFGLGGAQVFLTATVLTVAAMFLLKTDFITAIVIGFALSLSSTAFALQILAERGELTAAHGRLSFAVLLFQDLAVIPLIAAIPALALVLNPEGTGAGSTSVETLSKIGLVIGTIVGVILGGRFILRPILRVLAGTNVREIFTAASLLLVVGMALLMDSIGLSMGLGAFLAGVLLADSEYRHELEINIEPFKGLLLGLFFMAVGMSVDFGLLSEQGSILFLGALGLMAFKFVVLLLIARMGKLKTSAGLKMAAVLPQGGEFGFVVFSLAQGVGLLEETLASSLVLMVTMSMVLTPAIVILVAFLTKKAASQRGKEFDEIDEQTGIIVAGFGRFGQIVSRLLRLKGYSFTALEVNAEQVDFVRKFGSKIFYGDASRLDLLRAAGAESAKIFVLAIDDPKASVRTAEVVRQNFPELKVFARARNRSHAHNLMKLDVHHVVRETFHSSLSMGEEILVALGHLSSESKEAVRQFRDHDETVLRGQFQYMDNEKEMIQFTKNQVQELESLFMKDAEDQIKREASG